MVCGRAIGPISSFRLGSFLSRRLLFGGLLLGRLLARGLFRSRFLGRCLLLGLPRGEFPIEDATSLGIAGQSCLEGASLLVLVSGRNLDIIIECVLL